MGVMYSHLNREKEMDRSSSSGLTNKNLGFRCLKYSIIIVSVLLTLLGWCLTGAGLFVYLTENFNYSLLNYVAIIAMTLGIASVVIGAVGCCSAVVRRSAIHITFIAFLIFGLLAVSIVCCWLFLQRNMLPVDTTKFLEDAIDRYFKDENSKQLMTLIQSQLECCGAEHGFGDYGDRLGQNNLDVCEMQFYPQPCHEPLAEYLSWRLLLVLSMATGIGGLLLVGFMLSLVMFCLMSRQILIEETV